MLRITIFLCFLGCAYSSPGRQKKQPKFDFTQIDSLIMVEASHSIHDSNSMLVALVEWNEGAYRLPDKHHDGFRNPFTITFFIPGGEKIIQRTIDNHGSYADIKLKDTGVFNNAGAVYETNEVEVPIVESDTTFGPQGGILKIHSRTTAYSPSSYTQLWNDTTWDATGKVTSTWRGSSISSDGPVREVVIYKGHKRRSYKFMLPISDVVIKNNLLRYKYYEVLEQMVKAARISRQKRS